MSPLILDEVTVSVDGQPLFAPLGVTAEPGAVTCIVGQSGSGKSSLLKHLCGILPTGLSGTGTVHIGTDDLTPLAPERRRMGLLFQDPLLFPHLSVSGNLLFGLREQATREKRSRLVAEALEAIDMGGFGERDPATLSGGQQTRIALMRVLLAEPRALLLDEPFSSLDEAMRHRVRALVFSEARRRRLPTLLVTHDQSDVDAAGGPVIDIRSPDPGGGESPC